MKEDNLKTVPQKDYLSVAEMAEEFGIHEMTFYRMIRDKKLPAFKIGSQWRIRRVDLESWLSQHASGQLEA